MRLGVLDLGRALLSTVPEERIRRTTRFAGLAERSGFVRYWIAEHHGPGHPLAAPEVVLAVVAGATKRLSVGPGGVLLRYYSPRKIAEVYGTLAAAYPGRVEVGVCRGPGVVSGGEDAPVDAADRIAHQLVSGHARELVDSDYERKVESLVKLARYQLPMWERTEPIGVPFPPIWLLGSGPSSLRQALFFGLPLAYACFLPGSVRGPELLTVFHEEFKARHQRSADVMLAVTVTCDETSARAKRLDVRVREHFGLSTNIVGDPRRCIEEILALCEAYEAKEVLVLTGSADAGVHEALISLIGEAAVSTDTADDDE